MSETNLQPIATSSIVENIKWQSALYRLGNLKDFHANPRKIGKKEFTDLVKSIQQDGYHQRLLINLDGTIIGGHQRKKAMLAAGFSNDDLIEVLVPSIPLSTDELNRILIRDNLPYGNYDFDILAANFEPYQLVEWGMPPEWIDSGFNEPDPPKETKEKKEKTCPHCGEII